MNRIQNVTIKSEISSASNNTTVTVYLNVGDGRLTELGIVQRAFADYEYTSCGEIKRVVRCRVVCFSQIYHLSQTAHNIHDQLFGDYNWADIHAHTVQTPYYSSGFSILYIVTMPKMHTIAIRWNRVRRCTLRTLLSAIHIQPLPFSSKFAQ